jgi:hypothetical protein
MPVWVADRKVYVNTRGTQTVKICTPRNQQGQYERYYRIAEKHALSQRDMLDRVAKFHTIPDLEAWLVNDRRASRESENEFVSPTTAWRQPAQHIEIPLPLEYLDDFPDEDQGSHAEPAPVDAGAFLQSHERQEAIGQFIDWCNQPYVDYFDLTPGRADEIANRYFDPLRHLSDAAVFHILGIMIAWIRHQTEVARRKRKHIPIDEWKGCCTGVAEYLLRPRAIDGDDRMAAASALQRLNGWYYTGIPLWYAFRRPARLIGDLLCGAGVLH